MNRVQNNSITLCQLSSPKNLESFDKNSAAKIPIQKGQGDKKYPSPRQRGLKKKHNIFFNEWQSLRSTRVF